MASTTLFPGVALVTGAAGTGIGNATAHAFAEAGCTKIAITDLNAELLGKTKRSIFEKYPKITILSEAGDIASEAFVTNFVDRTVRTFGRVDYCVNCAGILSKNESSTEMSVEDFDKINNVNYRGCWLTSRAELNAMLKQEPLPSHDGQRSPQRGSIVNIASQLGIVGRPRAPAYCSSKAAVVAMTRCDAIDYSEHGIRVNCVCPGVIETPMTTGSPELIERLKPAVDIAPVKRMGKPSEIADAALFLCSTKASFVQGHAMVVDGGFSLKIADPKDGPISAFEDPKNYRMLPRISSRVHRNRGSFLFHRIEGEGKSKGKKLVIDKEKKIIIRQSSPTTLPEMLLISSSSDMTIEAAVGQADARAQQLSRLGLHAKMASFDIRLLPRRKAEQDAGFGGEGGQSRSGSHFSPPHV